LEHKQARLKTVSSLIPLNLRSISEDQLKKVISDHLLNPKEFFTDFPIPCASIDSPHFNPNRSFALWRGPTWIATNWYVIKGLEKQLKLKPQLSDLINPALNELKTRIIELIKKSGFREYYNPFTGDGYGATNFGWSGLVIDLL
jgi:glycogen debranching enzyme